MQNLKTNLITSFKFLIMLTFVGLLYTSCSEKETQEPDIVLKDITISTTKTSTSITLSWKPVEGCFWYKISTAKSGAALSPVSTYQDIKNDPITYTLSGLTANTAYDIKLEGTDYSSGGKLLASKTITISTNP